MESRRTIVIHVNALVREWVEILFGVKKIFKGKKLSRNNNFPISFSYSTLSGQTPGLSCTKSEKRQDMTIAS